MLCCIHDPIGVYTHIMLAKHECCADSDIHRPSSYVNSMGLFRGCQLLLKSTVETHCSLKLIDNSTDSAPQLKRSKFNAANTLKCHNCGKIGHRAFECRYRFEVMAPNATNTMSSFEGLNPCSNITCFRYGNPEHFASRFPSCNGGASGVTGIPSCFGDALELTASSHNERRVDVCYVSKSNGVLMNIGHIHFNKILMPSAL